MPRSVPARTLLVVAALAPLAACSYESGSLSQPSGTARTATTLPAPQASGEGPVVGTLPPITQPGQVLAPPVTAPPETVPAETVPPETLPPETAPPRTAAPATEPPATTAPTPPPSTAPAAPPSTAKLNAARYIAVQAGAFASKDAADAFQATLQSKGIAIFQIAGTGPYRLVAVGFTKDKADAMVQRLAGLGIQAMVFTTTG